MLYNIFDLNELTIILDTYINGFNINIFNLLTFLAIISSILVIITNNPIISVLYLINLFLIISLILILHGLNFIGISYLLVYVGAVSMLFLFILMLIDIRISELHFESKNSLFLAFFISWLFYLFIGNVTPDYSKINTYKNISYISYNTWDKNLVDNYDIISIGNVLYSSYALFIIITCIILLLAMVGSIIINISNSNEYKFIE